jgi:hypothetical protein
MSSNQEANFSSVSVEDERVRFFRERLHNNPQQFLDDMEVMSNELNHLRAAIHISSFVVSDPPVQILSLFSSLDPQIAALMQLLMVKKFESRSEKLPNISEYEGDESQLDAWEQSLIQRMHINNDRYPFEQSKIAYGENRLTIGKKAHNLMNPYRVDGICILTSFVDWRFALRRACGNPYEQEDARKYLRETLKQGSMSFEEYYNLFSQKKDRFKMEDASLIDVMKANINYFTQSAVLMYRVSGTNQRSITFEEHVIMWLETDRGLRQIRHIAPKASTTSTAIITLSKRSNPPLTILSTAPPIKAPASSLVLSSPPIGDPMDLSSAMAAVKGQFLKTEGVRKICEDWKLCFYCKLQHSGRSAADCPNKKINLRSMELQNSETDQEKA